MEENVSFTIKLTVERHTKLKVLSAMTGLSMTRLISKWIDKQEVQYNGSTEKTEKPIKKKKQKMDNAISIDKEEIKKSILTYKDEGMSFQNITDRLNADKVSTFSGRGQWNKSTVARLYKQWTVKPLEP